MAERKHSQGIRNQRAKNVFGTTKRLVVYMSTLFWWLIFALVMAVGATIMSAIAPSVLGLATTEIANGISQGLQMRSQGIQIDTLPIDFNQLIRILIVLVVLYLIQVVLRYFQNVIIAYVSQKTVYNLRKDMKAKMAKLPIQYYDTHSNGDIMSRAVNDMDQIANTLQQSIIQFMNGFVLFFIVLIVMFIVNVRLSLVVVITVPISALMIALVAPRSQKQFANQQKELGILNNQVEEIYSGHTIVKTYNQEEEEIEKFLKQSKKLDEASWKAQFLANIMMPLVNFARDLGYFGIGIVGGLGVINGTIPIGHVQAFMQYVNQFSQPVRLIAQLANTIQVTIASCERIFEVIDEEPMKEIDSNVKPNLNSPYKIEFDHVQFGYGDTDEDLLMTDFNLKVHPGEMVAVVGPTGAGKSTLINLLERFYDVKGGNIRYDGVDLRDFDRNELRSHFSIVLQDTWLFNGTIWENIAYGNEQLANDKDAILKAAKAAYVDEFVRRLPKGYDTMINEEASNISQGQRQLITIARAFLSAPDVLILDEATSSVDTRTETLIQKAMNNILEGRTSFVVAHRLSTIRDADQIIVMQQGNVIETGTHNQLMEADGFYANLYNAQFTTGLTEGDESEYQLST